MSEHRRGSNVRGVGVAAAIALVTLLVLLWTLDGRPRTERVVEPEAPRRSAAGSERRGSALESAGGRADGVPERSAAKTASIESASAASAPVPASMATRALTAALRLHFARPDGHEIAPPTARVELVDDSAGRRAVETHGQASALFTRLPIDVYRVGVDAPGLLHRSQIFTITAKTIEDARSTSGQSPGARTGPSDPDAEPVLDEDLFLWPDGWIAVIVRTRDDRPLEEIANELEIEPRRIFFGVFDVRTRVEPPDENAWSRGDGSPDELATFHRVPDYQRWRLPGDAVGSLELRRPPPLWVGLAVYGVPLGWELVRPGENEVVFRIDANALLDRCARLHLRVVDARTRAPLPDARVTLRADTAPHRRSDQENVAPRADGTVHLERIVPGKYELTVSRGEDLDQRRITLAPREDRTLGEIALEHLGGIELSVVDERGEPVAAYIEIAPYEAGRRVDALYPPMLHRRSDAAGRYRLPVPAQRSLVRARVEGWTTAGQPTKGARTENHVLDPAALPAQPWTLVLRETKPVTFEASSHGLETIEVEDELGIVVVWPPARGKKALRCDLLPGRYRARFLDREAAILGEAPFVVTAEGATVRWP